MWVVGLEYGRERVPHYETDLELPDSEQYVEVKVFTNYGSGFEEHQSVEYVFPNSSQLLVGRLEDFTKDRALPAIVNCFSEPRMTLMRTENDRVEAVNFAERIVSELDDFLA